MSIYLKSAAVVIVCMGLGVWGLSFIAVNTVKSEAIFHTERENQKATQLLSQDLGRELKMFISKMNTMAQVIEESPANSNLTSKISAILNSEDDFVSFGVYSLNQDKYSEVFFMAKPESLAEFGFQLSDLKNFSPDTLALDVKQSPKGFRFDGLAPAFKSTLINFSYLIKNSKGTWLVRSEVRQDHWVRYLNHYPNLTSSILDSKNKVIMSSNADLTSKVFDDDADLVTSYQNLNLGDLKVAVSSPKQGFASFEKSLNYRMTLVGIMVLGLSLIASILFSGHIVTPLKNLLGVLERVISGQNDVNLSVSRGDEIGSLARGLSQLIDLFKNSTHKPHLAFQGAAPMADTVHNFQAPRPLIKPAVQYAPQPAPQEKQYFEDNSKVVEVTLAKIQDIKTQTQVQKPEPLHAPAEKDSWFLVRNSQSTVDEGPFTFDELKTISNEPGFIVAQAYVYRTGDSYMTPLIQMAGLSRRTQNRPSMPETAVSVPPPEVQAKAQGDEWYLYGGEDRTLGPYTVQLLKEAVETGQIPRASYCWRQGMTQWIFVYEIPGFDRRDAGPPMPPIPIGKVS